MTNRFTRLNLSPYLRNPLVSVFLPSVAMSAVTTISLLLPIAAPSAAKEYLI